jgi:hypothetical protein
MNARIQTWFPFAVQICLNGREWLARQMDGAGLAYFRQDNCFPWIADWQKAQRLMDRQLRSNWPKLLDGVARKLNPIHKRIFRQWPLTYYWSTYQSEWAIDLVFPQPEDLRRLYPRLVHHGMTTFGSADVMRFLGRRVPASGEVPRGFSGEIVGDLKQRQKGVRIKHSINGNPVKLYDKAYTPVGSVLRAEMTMHNGADIRVSGATQAMEGTPGAGATSVLLRRQCSAGGRQPRRVHGQRFPQPRSASALVRQAGLQ